MNPQWIYDTPVLSSVEAKLRELLVELGNDDKILGIQVCAYKDGKVIIDTAAGMLDECDLRPVQPDSLFPVFSATKGVTAGMLHWLVDNGKLRLDENVANVWPEFGSNGKDDIKVCHVLNHTSGLHYALGDIAGKNPLLFVNFDECLNLIATSAPETEPGQQQLYHSLSFGWICGGIIEHASGKKFQEILEEAFIHPLNIEGELYIGIPPGIESRLASLTVDMDEISKLSSVESRYKETPSTLKPAQIAKFVASAPAVFNLLQTRQAIIPAANGHCSARALARYYATLVDGGVVPPPHPHISKFPPLETNNVSERDLKGENVSKIFSNPRICDAFMGTGEYGNLTLPGEKFGLGFGRVQKTDGTIIGFGHAGLGGSTGFCDIENRFAMSMTLNKMSLGYVPAKIVQLVCSELSIPFPKDYYTILGGDGSDAGPGSGTPLIN